MPGLEKDDILVIGGYGEVGGRLAALLDEAYPGRVIRAGRNPSRAARKPARFVDVDKPESIDEALEGVGVVAACVLPREPHLLKAVVRRGLAYTSIAPLVLPWHEVQALHDEARETGARVILASGIEPGISSMLVRSAIQVLGGAHTIESALLLSIGDAFGADSMAFILREMVQPYQVKIDGRERTIHAFEHPRRVQFPPPIGTRTAYTMAFTDQRYYPMTLGARTAMARIALDPPWLGPVIAGLLKLGGRAWLARRAGRGALYGAAERLQQRYRGRDSFALVVEVRRGDRAIRASLLGRTQARAAALGAFATVCALADREQEKPGVWLAEQALDPARFLERLARHGLVPMFEDTEGVTSRASTAVVSSPEQRL
jgi:short subunit dehydrogenase-like uncharacterized protein